MNDTHAYQVEVEWLGNRGTGTSGYRAYGREHVLRTDGTHEIEGSADPTFHGDAARWNPEELLLGALAQCHMMSYLHMAVRGGIVVVAYTDRASGTLITRGLGGAFAEAVLRPVVTVADSSMVDAALAAHAEAREHCFIANSVNFQVRHEPEIRVAAREELSHGGSARGAGIPLRGERRRVVPEHAELRQGDLGVAGMD